MQHSKIILTCNKYDIYISSAVYQTWKAESPKYDTQIVCKLVHKC